MQYYNIKERNKMPTTNNKQQTNKQQTNKQQGVSYDSGLKPHQQLLTAMW